MTPAEQAQKQAEEAMDGFILWSKRATLWSAIALCIVMFACNNGVDGSGSSYTSGLITLIRH
jgi:hypothetical protein